MKIRLRGEWAIFAAMGVIVVVFLSSFVAQAVEARSWLVSPLERTLRENTLSTADAQRHIDCRAGSIPVAVAGSHEPRYVSGECWRESGGGMHGVAQGVSYIRVGGHGSAGVVANMPGSFEIVGDRLLHTYRMGSRGNYIQIYDSPMSSLKFGNYGNPRHLELATNSSGWFVTATGSTTPEYHTRYASSRNGQWLVVEQSGIFVRVDLNTRQSVPFAKESYGYGYGLDPTYELDISDDGRYVVINGGNLHERNVTLYDIESCDSRVIVARVATGCQSRNIKPFMTLDASQKSIQNIWFNPSGDMLFYSIQENNVFKRYSLSWQGSGDHQIEYLALGDSYSSGEGDEAQYYIPGTNGDGMYAVGFEAGIAGYPYDKEKCRISMRSYPYLMAQHASLSTQAFHSVACSGADVNDVLNTTTPNMKNMRLNGSFDQLEELSPEDLKMIKNSASEAFIPGRTAQIEFLTTYKPRAVTMSLGGNDIGFADILSDCVISKTTSCDWALSDRYQIAQRISTTVFANLSDTYRRFREASPGTHYYIAGYPQIFTTRGTCDLNAQLDQDEREFATMTINYLNTMIKSVAEDYGFTYIDVEHALDGKNLCSGEDYPVVNGLTAGNDVALVISAGSYHPNDKGHTLIAASIMSQLGNSPITSDRTVSSPRPCARIVSCTAPAIPAYFKQYGVPDTQTASLLTRFVTGLSDGVRVFLDSPRQLVVSIVRTFKPGSTVRAELHSTPRQVVLSSSLVSSDGSFSATATIPSDTPIGYHTLHIIGQTPSGESIDLYQPVWVLARENDIDGDSIENDVDPCPFVEASKRDVDGDKIDDACDGAIGPAKVTNAPTETPKVADGKISLLEQLVRAAETVVRSMLAADSSNVETLGSVAGSSIESKPSNVLSDTQRVVETGELAARTDTGLRQLSINPLVLTGVGLGIAGLLYGVYRVIRR